ncbi:hypothetical protein IQ272_01300 [Chroococcidiopsidales cyanobacterium LEGE 13417]|uniref:hypothetical protein n=1 Tax=Chroococcidiopsis sp. CCALA 051 TaxID=869949 RepID=UPI0011B24695|nr:hypothetical protein [Chroococcidiopsis sp. CCALA 051]MBE9014807.1 hypothetical protein [Chroococcidiopsidales cyanobacterium LEGE 13417]
MLKKSLFGIAQKYLNVLVCQDIQMMEEEQLAYLLCPERQNYELDPALASVTRLMRHQVAKNTADFSALS